MSLRPDDRTGRGRSGSSAGRERSRSRSDSYRNEAPPPSSSMARPSGNGRQRGSSPMPGSFIDDDEDDDDDDDDHGKDDRSRTRPSYETRTSSYARNNASKQGPPPSSAASRYTPVPASSQSVVPYPADGRGFQEPYNNYRPNEHASYGHGMAQPPQQQGGYYPPPPPGPPPRREDRRDDRRRGQSDSSSEEDDDDDLAYGAEDSRRRERDTAKRSSTYESDAHKYQPYQDVEPRTIQPGQYRYPQNTERDEYSVRTVAPSRGSNYAGAPPEPVQQAAYRGGPQEDPYQSVYRPPPPPQDQLRRGEYPPPPQGQSQEQLSRTYSQNGYDRNQQVINMAPRDRQERAPGNDPSRRASTHADQSALQVARAPGLNPQMQRLSISGGLRPDMSAPHEGGMGGGGGGGLPPPSPLLEAYRGTYQSISPMPLTIRPPEDDDDELDGLSTLSPTVSRSSISHGHSSSIVSSSSSRRDGEKKRVKVYDPESDAKLIASALNHHKPDADAISSILPALTHDHIMGVRKEYKKQVRVQGKGVNLSKHVKTKLAGNFGKAVYVTTLGRWESEGYWANFWYQAHGSRRELLIESLMGRTNSEIRMIKDEFKDKRYSDSLSKCMEKELKMDKFRTAVLMALEERRQEEQDVYPAEYVHRDCDALYRAVKADRGGESTMLEVVVRRSDAHLREVLRTYERIHGDNFARAALKKSGNLVGEVIAHILNGVINKSARDAVLVEHALQDIAEHNKEDDLRYELLISRMVRIHWDKPHMLRVKKAFQEKYRIPLEDAVAQATKGEFREYMMELCETR